MPSPKVLGIVAIVTLTTAGLSGVGIYVATTSDDDVTTSVADKQGK